jgi:hypothetical protein
MWRQFEFAIAPTYKAADTSVFVAHRKVNLPAREADLEPVSIFFVDTKSGNFVSGASLEANATGSKAVSFFIPFLGPVVSGLRLLGSGGFFRSQKLRVVLNFKSRDVLHYTRQDNLRQPLASKH